jgi:hypothetical protein
MVNGERVRLIFEQDDCSLRPLSETQRIFAPALAGFLSAEVSKVALRLPATLPSFALKPRFPKPFQFPWLNPANRLKFPFRFSEICLYSVHPDSPEGRCASSRVLGRDAVDALLLQDERL